MRASALPALCGLLLAACGEREAPQAPPLQRLADAPVGVLQGPPVPAPEGMLREGFAAGLATPDHPDGWRLATRDDRPLDVEEGVAEAELREGAGGSGGRELVLRGRRGVLYRVLPVLPGEAYRFRAEVRAEELDGVGESFAGAAPWVAELGGGAASWRDLEGGLDPLVVARHQFESGDPDAGWEHREVLFQTRAETSALLIACVLGLGDELSSGSVAFRGVSLEHLPERAHFEELRAGAVRDLAPSEPELEGWRARARVRAWLGGTWRPSILLLPGEELALRVRVPEGAPRLELGLGPWRPGWSVAREGGRANRIRFEVRAADSDLLDRELALPERLVDGRWEDARVDLSALAGQDVTLRLRVEGDVPGVYGAPLVVSSPESVGSTSRAAKNLVLVSIDTLRADHVGCYGGSASTPHLDALAAEGLRFEDVEASAPFTLPSHATMFSGQVPRVHGVIAGGRVLAPGRSPVLARILADAGYRTEALTAGGFLNADFGFDQGFDAFSTVDPLRGEGSKHLALLAERDPERFDSELFEEFGPDRVDAFLEQHRDEPFFLFLHTFTVHDYDPPPAWRRCHESGCTSTREDYREYHLGIAHPWTPQPVSDADRAHLGHLYDEALAYVDDSVGHVLAKLDELGLTDRTVVAVTSDHGEEMFERGFVQHGKTLYREVVRVPWLLRAPGLAPRVDRTPVSGLDVAPTLLAALGLPPDPRMQGMSRLMPTEPGTRWAEVDDGYVNRMSLTDDRSGLVLIHSPADPDVFFPPTKHWELYDLRADPGELVDRSETDPEGLRAMRDHLERLRDGYEALATQLGEVGEGKVDEATRVELEELGYGGK